MLNSNDEGVISFQMPHLEKNGQLEKYLIILILNVMVKLLIQDKY